jgi:tetratricopeptide (TPR) repeat protein
VTWISDVLGNAHLTNFFTNGQEMDQLTQALKAYAQTERTMKEPNPDLFFNRATIYEYLERYSEACRDYNLAHAIDQTLAADKKSGQIVDYVVKTSSLVLSRADSKN